jgi:histidyl-tRNA synthetase
LTDITVAIDKLDKIGLEKVKLELAERGLGNNQIALIEKYLLIEGDNEKKLHEVKSVLGDNETFRQGIMELESLYDFLRAGDNQLPVFDFTLARGLNYYTGIIYEIKANGVQMGSIGGGGRYDDLTGLFGVPNLPGVGISFGVDRIYDVMEELRLFPEGVFTGTQVLFFNLGSEESRVAYGLMQNLRAKDIRCEIFHEPAKFDKQFKYAEKKNIPYVVLIGSKELEEKYCVVKNLKTGKQERMLQEEVVNFSFV